MVLRDLFAGKSTYGELQSSPEGIPANILAERLKRLAACGNVEKEPCQQNPVRYACRLSRTGRSPGPVTKAMLDWGSDNVRGTEARIKLDLQGLDKKSQDCNSPGLLTALQALHHVPEANDT
jgi:DNA-binding HxlR family transcriptional regulator